VSEGGVDEKILSLEPHAGLRDRRAERVAAVAAVAAAEATAQVSAASTVRAAANGPMESALDEEAIGLTDTVVFQHRVVQFEAARRERERILPPGAGGPNGTAYKMLRTQVMRRLHDLGANTLAVLSADKGEGKTLTAINLAIAVAADLGHTALLVDFDLHNPSVHRRLGFEPQVGVEDCLLEQRPIYEAMVKVAGYERLTVLPARRRLEQSSEWLAGQRAAELVEELRARYYNRVLIFDLPPVLLTDDALAFSRHVQAGLFVVSERKTARDGVTRSLTLLNNLPIVGTVLNRSQDRPGAYY
jgi:protein-tyrosine kinase